MFAPNLCAWRKMFAAYEKMEPKRKKSEIKIKRKQLNNYEFQKSEIRVTSKIEEHKNRMRIFSGLNQK